MGHLHLKVLSENFGQMLVEVVVVLGVVVLLVTGIISGVTYSLKASQNARARSLAIKYVQQGMETARQDRENSWYAFKNLTGSSITYCLGSNDTTFTAVPNLLTITSDPVTDCAGNVHDPSLKFALTRYATFTWQPDGNNPVDKMRVTVTVNWNESGTQRKSQASSDFTQWR
jgi:type II secretory pathway pseudopilin PulG